jgi:hypothetical protein
MEASMGNVIRRQKPAHSPVEPAALSPEEVAIIDRGGGVTAPNREPAAPAESDRPAKFTLRLARDLLDEIERAAKTLPDPISVNTWLVGAAKARLAKERKTAE